jgi:hypothetical protein
MKTDSYENSSYVVVGDGMGIVRFFDHHFKLLRWSRNFNLPAIRSISFSRFDEIPEFKKNFREEHSLAASISIK